MNKDLEKIKNAISKLISTTTYRVLCLPKANSKH